MLEVIVIEVDENYSYFSFIPLLGVFCIVFVGLKQEIGKNERESRQQNFFIPTEKKCQKTDEEKRQCRATEGEGMFNCFSQCV